MEDFLINDNVIQILHEATLRLANNLWHHLLQFVSDSLCNDIIGYIIESKMGQNLLTFSGHATFGIRTMVVSFKESSNMHVLQKC